jgi:hypothetical protein
VRRQQYLRPPGSDAAADDVIGTVMKMRIHRHLIHPYQRALRPLRPPKLSLNYYGSGCVGVYRCAFGAVPMTALATVSDFGGHRYLRFVHINFLLSLAAPHLHGVLFLVTGSKHSFANISANFRKNRNGPYGLPTGFMKKKNMFRKSCVRLPLIYLP